MYYKPTELWDLKRTFTTPKQGGLEKVDLFCTDRLAVFMSVVRKLFDSFKTQRCLIHVWGSA